MSLELEQRRLQTIRDRIAYISHRANSAHFGSSLSCVEIIDAIIGASGIMPETVIHPDRSRIIISKGHAAMGYYCSLEAWGLLTPSHLENYLNEGSALWGHVTCAAEAPVIDASTGSLGHGLSLVSGFALAYRLRNWPAQHYCVLSDGECDEGSTWEAALFAGHHRLDRVCAIIDYNKIQSLNRVSAVLQLEPLGAKWESFGWDVHTVDGHDRSAIANAINLPSSGRPRVIIASTTKGKGISRIEDTIESHYRPATAADVGAPRNA